jgi:hypothetical protein
VLFAFNDAGAGDKKELRATDGDMLDGKGHSGIIRFQGFKSFKVSKIRRIEVSGRARISMSRGKEQRLRRLSLVYSNGEVPPLGPIPRRNKGDERERKGYCHTERSSAGRAFGH